MILCRSFGSRSKVEKITKTANLWVWLNGARWLGLNRGRLWRRKRYIWHLVWNRIENHILKRVSSEVFFYRKIVNVSGVFTGQVFVLLMMIRALTRDKF